MHPKIDSRVLEKDYGVIRVIEIAGQVLLDAISFENDLFTSKSGLFLSGTLSALIYRSHASSVCCVIRAISGVAIP